MAGWWSIEVFHGEFSARRWQDTYSNALIEAALSLPGQVRSRSSSSPA